MSETSEGTTVDVEAIEAGAQAALDGAFGPLPDARDRSYGPRLRSEDAHAIIALCARVRELEAVLRRCRQGHENLIEVGALPHAGWNDAAREVIAEIDAALAPSQPEAAR
jgi:hypothetical protein